MTRTPWGEQLNDLRPRPFNRAENVLPYVDNLFGEWVESSYERIGWTNYDIYQPYDCWILPEGETPSITEVVDATEFLRVPYPCYYKGETQVYLRNLNCATLVTSVTSATIAVQVSPSTITPIYSTDHLVYASTDGFESWDIVDVRGPNLFISSITGTTVEFAYIDPSTTIAAVTGSTFSPAWYPFFNTLDEYGLELGLPRLDNESNSDYRVRLYSVLAIPGTRTEVEVAIDTARRLGLMQVTDWNYNLVPRNSVLNLQDLGAGFDNQASWCTFATSGTLATASGLRRECYSFDGTNFAQWSPVTGFEDPGSGMGLSLWVYPTLSTSAEQNLVQQGTVFSLYLKSDQLCATIGTVSRTNIAPITTDQWQFITFESAGAEVRIAVNATVHHQAEEAGWTFVFNEDAWVFGSNYEGRIDEVQLSDLAFSNLRSVYQQIIPTNGYPTVVVGPTGLVDQKGWVDELLISSDGAWLASYSLGTPCMIYEGTELDSARYYADYTISDNQVTLTLATGSHELHARYGVEWWGGNEGVVPLELSPGKYKVYTATGVTAYGLSNYRDDSANGLINARGILTDRGVNLLRQLGDPLLWSTRTWGETLFFYGEEPPLAPTQQVWDQDLGYDGDDA